MVLVPFSLNASGKVRTKKEEKKVLKFAVFPLVKEKTGLEIWPQRPTSLKPSPSSWEEDGFFLSVWAC